MSFFILPQKFLKQWFLLLLFASFALNSCSSDENIIVIPSEGEDYEIHFIDVGQGDAILVTTPDKILLVDGGPRASGVTAYLQDLEIETIDIVIGTHPHADHIGGLIEVFHSFTVGKVIDPGVSHTTVTYSDYMAAIENYEIPLKEGRKGMKWELSEGARMKLLHPVSPSSSHLNNASVVARVTLGELVVLLTGDAEKEAEAQMLNDAGLLPAHILKVGHHGSWTSSTTGFLEAVQPEVSVIMCGEDNPYGHPHDVAMERLNATGTDIYRTDLHGHIVIETDGTEYTVSTTFE